MPVGTVKGLIADPDTKEGAAGATIETKGPENKTIFSEADGTYSLDLPPGAYTIIFTVPGRESSPETRNVVVVAGGTQVIDIIPELTTETIVIVDRLDLGKSSALLAQRSAAATVSDSIGSEQIARSPDSNTADVGKRMVSATIQDNRYIVIRGLGGRYSLTLLNGVPVPSPDPDIPAAPLDLFPASMVTSLTINKTFSPDQPGNFAGGALTLDTRTYPSEFQLKAKLSLSGDSQSSFRSVNGYDGGALDVLGFDDGTRGLPSAIPVTKLAGDPNLSTEQRAAQASGFNNEWTVNSNNALPNLGLSATAGDTLRAGKRPIGYTASLSYSHASLRRTSHIARVGESNGAGGTLPSVLQLDDEQGITKASVSGLASTSAKLDDDNVLNGLVLYSHSADDSAGRITGTENSGTVVDRTRLRFLERSMTFLQAVGNHRLADGKVKVDWQGNLAFVGQNEPDTRDLLRTSTPNGYVIDRGSGSAERLFSTLDDTTGGGGADARLLLGRVQLKAGASILASNRDYQARRFHFDVLGASAALPPDQAFDPSNAGIGMSVRESTLPSDGYTASRTIAGGYVMSDLQATDKLRLIGGVRFEHSSLDVELSSKIDLMAPPTTPTKNSDNDLLPSLNLVYAAAEKSNLRAAYGLTVARANFREIAPALYYDYVRRRAIGGNPMLEETTIHNFDLRWETFLGDSEVLAASLFAKRFNKPIEQTLDDAGDGQNASFANADGATSYGLELEARLSLSRIMPALSPFSISGNLSIIQSDIDLGGANRALQGQSPYVANLALGYEPRKGTQLDLLFNSYGRRIEEVGTGGAADVFEEPIHRLDFAASHKLTDRLKLKLAGSNLLNQRAVRTQNGVEILASPLGVSAMGSVELNIN
jgi:outer membrane receptor protein involved in Fe transport